MEGAEGGVGTGFGGVGWRWGERGAGSGERERGEGERGERKNGKGGMGGKRWVGVKGGGGRRRQRRRRRAEGKPKSASRRFDTMVYAGHACAVISGLEKLCGIIRERGGFG